jgi:hypothetical protein
MIIVILVKMENYRKLWIILENHGLYWRVLDRELVMEYNYNLFVILLHSICNRINNKGET